MKFTFVCFLAIMWNFKFLVSELIRNKLIFFFPFIGIPSRKINNTTRSSADSRNGLNFTEGEARGNGTQPVLSGTGEETVRLGKQRVHKF